MEVKLGEEVECTSLAGPRLMVRRTIRSFFEKVADIGVFPVSGKVRPGADFFIFHNMLT